MHMHVKTLLVHNKKIEKSEDTVAPVWFHRHTGIGLNKQKSSLKR